MQLFGLELRLQPRVELGLHLGLDPELGWARGYWRGQDMGLGYGWSVDDVFLFKSVSHSGNPMKMIFPKMKLICHQECLLLGL